MSFFRQRKNKRFSYTPRHQREMQDEFKDDIETKWQQLRAGSKRKGNKLASMPVLVVLFVMVLILMYVLSNYQ